MTNHQLQTVLDALILLGRAANLSHDATSVEAEAIAIVKQMMQAEPVAWMRKDEDMITAKEKRPDYAYTNYYDAPLYTHPAPQAVPASKVDRLKAFDDAESAMRRNPELSWRDAIADQFQLAYGIMGGKK